MRKFLDNEGQSWTIHLDLQTLDTVFTETEIDLLLPEVYLARVAVNPLLFARLLPVLLAEQLEARGLKTQDAILKHFSGRPYFDAEQAFYGALMDFFRAAGQIGRYDRILSYLSQAAALNNIVTSGTTPEGTAKRRSGKKSEK